ncbi:hypothetical protein F4781DRAFT_436625 [Annulohypoxylon bovei var. microspora]|nr:hypothetical protein F4781DRAFT_436625 [Annulohypoxylon bovei var. microspora]
MGVSIWWFWKSVSFAVMLLQHGVEGQSSSETKAISKTTSSPSTTITGGPFQGFLVGGATTTPISCPSGEAFVTHARYVACCATTTSSCALATACSQNAIVYRKGKTSDCGPLQCHLRKIFSEYGDKEPAFIQPICAGAEGIDTLYQAVPMTSRLIFPLVAADATTAATTYDSSIETGLGAPTNIASDSSSNLNATILGAVFGGIGILALIVFAFWYGRMQGIAKKASKGKGVYEMKTLSATRTSENTPSASLEGDPRLGSSNPTIVGTYNRSHQ